MAWPQRLSCARLVGDPRMRWSEHDQLKLEEYMDDISTKSLDSVLLIRSVSKITLHKRISELWKRGNVQALSADAQESLWHYARNYPTLRIEEYPPCSPDLNPLDFTIWPRMTSKMLDMPRARTNVEMRANVLTAAAELRREPNILTSVCDNFKKRVYACHEESGDHSEHTLVRVKKNPPPMDFDPLPPPHYHLQEPHRHRHRHLRHRHLRHVTRDQSQSLSLQ